MQRQTGAAFGAQVLRYSSVSWTAMALGQAAGLASALVVVRFLAPGDFGRLSLLYFFAALVDLLIGIGTRAGTMRQVFGAGDEDDDTDEEDGRAGSPAASTRRSLGTGIALTVGLGGIVVALTLVLSGPIGEGLLGIDNRAVVVWAAVAGSLGALYRLLALVVWMERRPSAFLSLSTAHPLLIVAAVVALVASGGGLTGAIAGTAIGSAVSALLALVSLRRSFILTFGRREALAILRRGPARLPVVGSYWVIDNMSIFLLSRFVAPAELGIFHLASRLAVGVVVCAASVRLALRPLMRTTFFAAVEEEYGAAVTRGVMLTYFALTMIGLTLGAALFAPLLVQLGPPSYVPAVTLIPLIAVAQVGVIGFRVLNQAVVFRRKRRVYVTSVITAAIGFVATALLLVPWLGSKGAPIALLVAFAGPTAYTVWRSQRGPRPLVLPHRPLALAAGAALACVLAYEIVAPQETLSQLAMGLVLFGLWLLVLPVVRAVPRHHRSILIQMARRTVGRGAPSFDVAEALRGLKPDERAALRMAVLEGRPVDQVAPLLGGAPIDAGERLVGLLRRAKSYGAGESRATEADRQIAEYLFDSDERDSGARRLLASGQVQAGDLHDLEAAFATLTRTPLGLWADDWSPSEPQDEPSAERRHGD